MSSPNQNDADLKAWLAEINANDGSVSRNFGEFGPRDYGDMEDCPPAAASADGSLESE